MCEEGEEERRLVSLKPGEVTEHPGTANHQRITVEKGNLEGLTLDIREKGAPRNGIVPTSERRLFLQLQVFTGCGDLAPLHQACHEAGLECVLYVDVNDPYGFGLLTLAEDPAIFVTELRDLLNQPVFRSCRHRPEMTMLGRTYATGYEPDLEDWLLQHPRRRVFSPIWSWAVWYPLRRRPEFELLASEEQQKILREHAAIGRAFGKAGYAQDVRLVCHGLDTHDNDFVIGLVGAELFPLSRIVQEMRKTRQTAQYLASLGPFFVGKVYWQSRQIP